ncbi:MAG: hypothetical protein FD187_3075 [bacterium]|jgi:Ca2+-binding EF-hand superfamily protein|nr:MAG: hypothetical protein FD142_3127 [bacterium]KAF0147097.1 MAG: hypothetical protein FD187_3075 [bacterium]KAF0164876.1 MAG: hypothetical protein FD158_3017 [bacterium]TXT16109.1 MAG: hypothetical protein FD132_3012 [bacterium]
MKRLLAWVVLMVAAGLAGATSPNIFSVHDMDRDGALSRAEYEALRAHCGERRGERCKAALLPFETLDADQDGRIDEAELLEALGRRHRGGRGG